MLQYTNMKNFNYPNDGFRQLVEGYQQFFNGQPIRNGFCPLKAQQIANTQSPHSMIVSCFDSRVCPEVIFNTDDGHICVHRNMLNQIDKEDFSMMASLRFAIQTLKIQNIVILGHSDCNAVAKLQHLDELHPDIRAWLDRTHTYYRGSTLEEAIKNNVLDQIDHLKTIDFVDETLKSGQLNIEGFYFHIDNGQMERVANKTWEFIPTQGI